MGPHTAAEMITGLSQTRLFGNMEKVNAPEGTLIFTDGEEGNTMFIISSGEVEIFKSLSNGSRHRLSVLGPGEVFGEMSLITGHHRSASARTLNNSLDISSKPSVV
ncbi:cyclic nucleotide-binding domain-containing protein [Ammoniphilus sp. 3BR4]|uniref:cyclic nucleotide-binding domain-containing protein n=1 Tax=Ammoniphilus sp. 3BR4 TaxID=3158265 RepID=UPI003466F8A3